LDMRQGGPQIWSGQRKKAGRRKIFCLCRGSNTGRPVCSQKLYWLSYPIWGIYSIHEVIWLFIECIEFRGYVCIFVCVCVCMTEWVMSVIKNVGGTGENCILSYCPEIVFQWLGKIANTFPNVLVQWLPHVLCISIRVSLLRMFTVLTGVFRNFPRFLHLQMPVKPTWAFVSPTFTGDAVKKCIYLYI
jgi:hypothetical protein